MFPFGAGTDLIRNTLKDYAVSCYARVPTMQYLWLLVCPERKEKEIVCIAEKIQTHCGMLVAN